LPNENNEDTKYKIVEIKEYGLSDNIVLVLYIIEKKYMNQIIRTNRSSIWKKENENWKIIFHQGTIVNKL